MLVARLRGFDTVQVIEFEAWAPGARRLLLDGGRSPPDRCLLVSDIYRKGEFAGALGALEAVGG